MAWWLRHLSFLYGGVLVAVFLLVALWETYRPGIVHALPASRRWLLNGFLWLAATVTAALVFRGGTIAVAIAVRDQPYGLLNRPSIPLGLRIVLAFLALDFVQYAGHYLRHSLPWLWRLHQVHHADRELDLSTGVRFHPGDMLFSQGLYLLAIAALAPPVVAVLCFELCDIAQGLFSHANLTLPPRFEKTLRVVMVSPEFHRVHHTTDALDQRSHLGVVFSFWDRLFGTHRGDSLAASGPREFGLREVSAAQSLRPMAMLGLPFFRNR